MSAEKQITVVVRADDLDGGYVASIPGLLGCVSQGDTVAGALRNIAEAYEGVRDTLAALDHDLRVREANAPTGDSAAGGGPDAA